MDISTAIDRHIEGYYDPDAPFYQTDEDMEDQTEITNRCEILADDLSQALWAYRRAVARKDPSALQGLKKALDLGKELQAELSKVAEPELILP